MANFLYCDFLICMEGKMEDLKSRILLIACFYTEDDI